MFTALTEITVHIVITVAEVVTIVKGIVAALNVTHHHH
jgi:hypothetical protein